MAVNPTSEQLAAVAASAGAEDDGPLVMLNLNRYRERARYASEPPGGVSPEVSGREAYNRYGEVALRVLAELGGEVVWDARARMTVIGEDGEEIDDVIAVRYPSAAAFLELAAHPTILAALPHREAGLERATLIRCEDPGTGPGLGS